MRIIFVSDPPTSPSAYGGQAALFIPRLRKVGHDVALLAMGGSAGATYKTPDGLTVYPTIGDPRGNDIVALHAKAHRADIVLTLGDAHAFSPDVYRDLPWLAWAPLDFETSTKATLRSLAAARWIWSPSGHGQGAYNIAMPTTSTDLGFVPYPRTCPVAHVPHGVDSKTFTILDHFASRRSLGTLIKRDLGGAFLVVSVGANKGTPARKGWYELLAAFKQFSDVHAEALLYLHTEISGIAGGEDLREVISLVGLDPYLVVFPPQYDYLCGNFKPSALALIYNAADVYLSASHGEGFSLPLYEGQLCGLPVIAPRNTAQTEAVLSDHTGKLVETIAYHPFDGATTWRRPIVQGLVDALESVRARSLLGWGNDRAQTRAKVLEFDVDRVFERCMVPALAKIAEEIK